MSERTDNIVIIGAGLGGLMSGAILSKEGYRVTVLEKNSRIGGGLQSYTRFGVVFDTGMHIFGGMNPGGNIRRICDYLGITDRFRTIPLDEANDITVHFGDGTSYRTSFNRNGFVEKFAEMFPAQRDNLQSYLNAVDNVVNELDLYHLRPKRDGHMYHSDDFTAPADEFVRRYVDDPKLRAILTVLNMFYAGESDSSPAYLHSVITSIFLNGACRVAGGYSTFADALASCILENRGKVETCEKAVRINTAGRNVTDVLTGSGKTFTATNFISAISPLTTVRMLDDERAVSKPYRRLMESRSSSNSAFIINIRLKKETMKYSDTIGFYLERPESAWSQPQGGSIDKIMFMTPPAANQGEWAETLNIIVPMTWDEVSKWEDTTVGHRGEEYEEFKTRRAAAIIDRMERIIPDIRAKIEGMDTATPLTIRDYTGVAEGAMCGFRKKHDDILSFIPVTTRVPNLFLTGQNINMHGFCGVTLTAIQTCEAITGENSILNKL